MGGKRVTDLEIETVFAFKANGKNAHETAEFMDIKCDRVYHILKTHKPMSFIEQLLLKWFGLTFEKVK